MSILARILSAVASRVRSLEDWWFDATRRVHTDGEAAPKRALDTIAPLRDGKVYLPARVRNVREVLRVLPIAEPAAYSLIDLGSGKGRVVFVATELPFRKALGVEYSLALHQQALTNLRSFRSREKAERAEFLHADAAAFPFPAGNLVLFLFNSFGPEVMRGVLDNLRAALRQEPRHVVIVLLWPELSDMIAAFEGVRQIAKTRRYDIFEIGKRP